MKHVPLRTCLGCRQRRAKRELVRLVRRADGVVVRDASGAAPGRGAYVCADAALRWSACVKGGRLSHAFRGACRLDEGLERAVCGETETQSMLVVHRR